MFIILLLSAYNGDVRALASEDWQTRRAAYARLERAGIAAVPSLCRVLRSDDVEVRRSANELLGPMVATGKASCRRVVVLVLIYAPEDAVGWRDLRYHAYAFDWIDVELTTYARARGMMTEADCKWHAESQERDLDRGEHLTTWLERIRRAVR